MSDRDPHGGTVAAHGQEQATGPLPARRPGAPSRAPPRIVGVVPAAGYAARLQPLRGSKEVVPVGGRPVMDHVVERMRLAGAEPVRVVTRPEKRDVRGRADELAAEVVLGAPASVAESLLLGLAGLDAADVALFGFPDTIWEPADGFVQALAALTGDVDVVLGVLRSPEPQRSDVVELDAAGHVLSVAVKPARPRSHLVWGFGAGRVGALADLRGHSEPGTYFDVLARSGTLDAVQVDGEMVDIGTRAALDNALTRFGDI